MSLKFTRALIDAFHYGSLAAAPTATDTVVGFEVPTECHNVPAKILTPGKTWAGMVFFDDTSNKLAQLFVNNFEKYASYTDDATRAAAPKLCAKK